MITAPSAQITGDHDIPIFSALFSTGAEWYLDYFQSIAVVCGVAAFFYTWWRTRNNMNFGHIMESAIAAMLIPSGFAFFLAALIPSIFCHDCTRPT